MFLARCGQKPSHSFAVAPKITCPFCNGKHRKHTYDERCNLAGSKEKKDQSVPKKPVPLSKDMREPLPGESSTPAPTKRFEVKSKPTKRSDEDEEKEPELESPDLEDAIVQEPATSSSSSRPKKDTGRNQVIVEDDTEVPVSQKKDPKIKVDLPIALTRIHQKLESCVELLKLHLKLYHLSSEQSRRELQH